MSDLERLSITIPKELAQAFDKAIGRKGYGNRSEAIRDLIRQSLVRDEWANPRAHVTATVTIVYDHHTRSLADKITSVQHDFGELIISALHVHLDHHNCLEVIVLRGLSGKVKALADRLTAIKGVKHAQLTLATEGKSIA